MKIAAIVQARMSSSRCPGKILRRVNGKPMLRYLLDRLERCRGLDGLVVATSTDSSDDPLVEYCAAEGLECRRGELNRVAARFLSVLDTLDCDAFARLNGDSPLLDPSILETALEIYRQGGYDVVCNVHPRSFPKGQGVEVIDVRAFRQAIGLMTEPQDQEHVTLHFYRHAEEYCIRNFTSGGDWSDQQLSVDTPDDFAAFEATVAEMPGPHWQYGYRDILDIRARLAAGASNRGAEQVGSR